MFKARDTIWLSGRKTCERYGISGDTLTRWMRDPHKGFPTPRYIGRYRYFLLEAIEQWEQQHHTAGRGL
jgi:hypothetical protein